MERVAAGAAHSAQFWSRALPVIAVALVLPLLPRVTAGSAPDGTSHVVEMSAFEFRPPVIRAAVGDTVVWQNNDAVVHTATGKGWSSGDVAARGRASVVLNTRGQLEYICAYHPSMKARIEVQ
jgi:plastocyanin